MVNSFLLLQSTQQTDNNFQPTAAPAPRKNILAKAAIFNNNVKQEENVVSSTEHVPKHLDRSKTAFLTQSSQNETVSSVNAADEINQLRQQAKTEEVVEEKREDTSRQSYQEEIYENYEQIQSHRQESVVQVLTFLSFFLRSSYNTKMVFMNIIF